MPTSSPRVDKSQNPLTPMPRLPMEYNVGTSLRHTFRLMQQRLQEIIQTRDIPVSMFYFLLSLLKEDGITQRELSDRVGILGPGTVEQLRRMEDRGLITRIPSTVDRRKMHVFLTSKGRTLTIELLPLAARNNSTALRGFSAAEKQTLRQYLARIRDNMGAKGSIENTPTIQPLRSPEAGA